MAARPVQQRLPVRGGGPLVQGRRQPAPACLRRALRQHYRNTTTLLVAQRVSSLRHADLILVLDDGCVIGAGNHEHLMETCEEYRIIAQTQMGDGKEAV